MTNQYLNLNNVRNITSEHDGPGVRYSVYFMDGYMLEYAFHPFERKPVDGHPGWVDMSQPRYDAGRKINIGPDEDLRPWTIPGHDPH